VQCVQVGGRADGMVAKKQGIKGAGCCHGQRVVRKGMCTRVGDRCAGCRMQPWLFCRCRLLHPAKAGGAWGDAPHCVYLMCVAVRDEASYVMRDPGIHVPVWLSV